MNAVGVQGAKISLEAWQGKKSGLSFLDLILDDLRDGCLGIGKPVWP